MSDRAGNAPMPRAEGETAPGFEPVRDALNLVVSEQSGTGAALAAWYDGRWVAMLHGGFADAERTQPWRPESIVMPYSVTKPFAAVCLLALVFVYRYVPETKDRDFEQIDTDLQARAHRGGGPEGAAA